jgi:histidine triad (HIT) family protein
MADDCLFCRIVRGEIPATIVASNADCVAFRDINPAAPTHVLVIPKTHVESLNQVADFSTVAAMTRMAQEVASAEGISESGFRVVFNTNGHGGQTVFHLHLHLIGGRRMGWPPG